MTTLAPCKLTCPVCDNRFESKTVVSTNSFGGKRTDFHERAAGTQPLPHLVHVCVTCGFAGTTAIFERGFDQMIDDDERAKLRVALASFAMRETTGSEKYEGAAIAANVMGEPHRAAAGFYLRAAWCCVDEGDHEAERYFRIKAAWRFIDALSSYDGVAREERATICYLIGELWRRAGHRGRAHQWFIRVPAEITDPKNQQWIVDLAAQQNGPHPREWFGW